LPLSRLIDVLFLLRLLLTFSFSFFFTTPSPTLIYPLSLHDALPISHPPRHAESLHPRHGARFRLPAHRDGPCGEFAPRIVDRDSDRKSTRLNSSHDQISYAVFCLKKKKKNTKKI